MMTDTDTQGTQDPTEADATAAPGADDGAAAALAEQVEALKQEVLYAQAETQNVRRRADRDVADARAYAATGFARDILSVSDNLSRALQAIPDAVRSDERIAALVTGLEATERELAAVFERNGVTRIASMGLPLDPNQHQAMMEVPTADAAPGTIVAEMQAGYMFRDRLLRPAMVSVAKAP